MIRDICRKNSIEWVMANYEPEGIRAAKLSFHHPVKLVTFFHGFDASRKLSDPLYVK